MKQSPIRMMIWTFVIVLFASGYVVSVEDGTVTVTIHNRTRHYLHVLINNQPYMYVAPGGSALTETGLTTVFVEVFYSPGQGISGGATRELTSVTTTTYSSNRSRDCSTSSSNSGSNDCSDSMVNSSVSGYTRSPMSWDVSPSELVADSTIAP